MDATSIDRIAELERERDLLNAIANYAPSLLCLVDADGRVRPTAANRAFEATLGLEQGGAGGELFWERYVAAEDAAATRAAIEAAVAGAPPVERDARWRALDGRIVEVAWSCTELPMIESGPVYLISATDITERKRHEEEVRRSRARIVAAADDARRRLERDLHDGAQQRLVALLLALRMLRRKAAKDEVTAEVDAAIAQLSEAIAELRELARGIHPATLTADGLHSALRAAAERSPLPVDLDVEERRFAAHVEAAAYYIASEALANATKHARATSVGVRVAARDDRLLVEVSDDGVGGADPAAGSGLRGLADRVAALDGTFDVQSRPGAGTRIRAELPLA